MTHMKWFILYVTVLSVSALAVPGRYFTDWCWAVIVFSVAWLSVGILGLRKGWIRR